MENKPDKQADMALGIDRAESVASMEPLMLAEHSRQRGQLHDLATELAQKSTGLRRSLPISLVPSVAALVRSMNCYYSNLIEGHDTHPIDIERALKSDYSGDPKQRKLQLEAKAHIDVQGWIDAGGLTGRVLSLSALCDIHRRFYQHLPTELCWTTNPTSGERVRIVPGQLRRRDVRVGHHVAISPGAVERFIARFVAAFARLGKHELILAGAAIHHRLAWIHPFLDGNGRVIRLLSHALYLELLDTGGLWSIARGLGRNVAAYQVHLANCDQPRRNDLDGRGALSEEALAAFTEFYLRLCIDQVNFMESLLAPAGLRARVMLWAEEQQRLNQLPSAALTLLDALLRQGELPRAEIAPMLGVSDRQARRVINTLVVKDAVFAANTRAPYRLRLPASLAARWLPGLFPEQPTPPTT